MFATLARRFISVAVKGLKARVRSPTGRDFDLQDGARKKSASKFSHSTYSYIQR